MAIWQEVEIEWDGRTERVRPSFELMQSIEQLGSFDTVLIARAIENELPITWCCEIVAKALYLSGVKVNSREIFSDPNNIKDHYMTVKASAYAILTSFADNSDGGSSSGEGGQNIEPEGDDGKKKANQ